MISLIGSLDFERKPIYQLQILAIDRGPPNERHTATVSIVVEVTDVNDNSPKFVKPIFTGGFTTDVDFGTVVMEVAAHDADAGANALITYYILGPVKRILTEGLESLHTEPFIINNRTGEISLNFDPQKNMRGKRRPLLNFFADSIDNAENLITSANHRLL